MQSKTRTIQMMGLALLIASLVGCNAPEVKRDQEIARFQQQLQTRAKNARIDPAKSLTMDQCVDLAIANSLDLSVRKLTLLIQDENVRIAFSGALPKVNATYTNTTRSNSNLQQQGNGAPVQVSDRHQQNLGVTGSIPILDYGLTYYSWKNAKDQRTQQRLLLIKSIQDLRRDVRVAYAQQGGAVRQAKLAQIAYEASLQVLRVAKSLEQAKLQVEADTALVQSAVAQAGLALSQSQQLVQQTHLSLSQLMSLSPGVDYSINTEMPNLPEPPLPQQVAAFEDQALSARPELAFQDLAQHISANSVRSAATEFFPKVNGIGSYNWGSDSGAVNQSFFLGGISVSQSLLDGGATIWRYKAAKKNVDVQKEQSLLVSLGVLYDVQFRALLVHNAWDNASAAAQVESARRSGLQRVISLYKEGLEDESGAATALANLTIQATTFDQAQTAYQVAWYQLEAAALPPTLPTAIAATQPSTRPTSTLDSLNGYMNP